MANLLEQYGIKEVADVTIYEIGSDGTEKPILFLDTLKVSTLEQTAEQSEARGGKGNSPLIIWDYGKEITLNIEDALYSPASMAIMFGGTNVDGTFKAPVTVSKVTKMQKVQLASAVTTIPEDTKYYMDSDSGMTNVTDTSSLTAGKIVYEEKTLSNVTGSKIVITAENFPGTYKIRGETYARNRKTGKDEYFQFIVNQAKMSAENNITLEAEGDPSVFNMTMRVLRPENGQMIELLQYTVGE